MPLPSLIGIDETWDTKGIHGPVCFYYPGAGFEKIFCHIKLCFHQNGIQPNISANFQEKGRGITDFDKQA